MTISELTTCTSIELEQLSDLMYILDPALPLTAEKLEQVMSCPTSHLFVMRQGDRLVGCYTLCLFCSPTGRKASIEDVVVHTDFQGLHLGRRLMEHALEQLKKLSPIHAQLTSRPHRVAANALYRAVGFQPKDTNVYVLDL